MSSSSVIEGTRKLRRATIAQVKRMRMPKIRWGGRWLSGLIEVPDDGEWYEVAVYAPTTGYQIAKALNIASALPDDRFEFGNLIEDRVMDVLDDEGEPTGDEEERTVSVLFVRRKRAKGVKGVRSKK